MTPEPQIANFTFTTTTDTPYDVGYKAGWMHECFNHPITSQQKASLACSEYKSGWIDGVATAKEDKERNEGGNHESRA